MMKTVRLESPDGARLVLAGGILGLAEDGPELAEHLEAGSYDDILLGIPFEDLDAIRATTGREGTHEFERDAGDEAYLKLLARFGRTQVPPGDLYAAYEYAKRRGLNVEAIDLGDEGHTAVWTQHVGMFELMRSNRRLKRIGDEEFHAKTAEEFAREWDRALFPTKGLRRVQSEREAWMAKRIGELAQRGRRAFALVPLARWAGVRERLTRDAAWREAS